MTSSIYQIQDNGLASKIENNLFSNLKTKQLAATMANRLPIAKQFLCM